jgi:hypothetical protein
MSSSDPVAATAVPVLPGNAVRVRIPTGLKPGDSFVVARDDGKTFTVIIPEGALPDGEIEVIVPVADTTTVHATSDEIAIKKTTAGAALAGAVVGTLILGPIGGLLLAGGAAYATTM